MARAQPYHAAKSWKRAEGLASFPVGDYRDLKSSARVCTHSTLYQCVHPRPERNDAAFMGGRNDDGHAGHRWRPRTGAREDPKKAALGKLDRERSRILRLLHLWDRGGARLQQDLFSVQPSGDGTASGAGNLRGGICRAPDRRVLPRPCRRQIRQGFSASGEQAGANSMTLEHAPPNRRGFFTSFTLSGTQAGSILATAVFLPVAQRPED